MSGDATSPFIMEPPLPADALADVRQLLQCARVQLVLIALCRGEQVGCVVPLRDGRYIVVPHPLSIPILARELQMDPLRVMVTVSAAVTTALDQLRRHGSLAYTVVATRKPGGPSEPSEN